MSPGFLVFPLLSLQAIAMGGRILKHAINWEELQLHVSNGLGFQVSPILYSDPLKYLQYPGGAVVKKIELNYLLYIYSTTGLRNNNNPC